MTCREKGELVAGGGGGDSGDLGTDLEGPGKRAETSRSSARDLPPGCQVMLRAKRGELASEVQVAGLKGWLPGGGGVASMAAVTGTGLEGPGRGWGGGRRGDPEAASGLRASRLVEVAKRSSRGSEEARRGERCGGDGKGRGEEVRKEGRVSAGR